MTLLSRILGLLRDVMFAIFIGASPAMDAFLVAFKIPNFMRRLFAEGAFAQSFVPVLSETRSKHGLDAVRDLANVVWGTLGGVLAGVTALGVVGAPVLVMIFAPGFMQEPGQYDLAVDLLRITFAYLFFISLVALCGGILNSYDRFAIPAVTPVWLNICFIVAIWFWHPSVYALAWAVFAAGLVQLLFQLPWLAKLQLFPRPRWGWSDPRVQKIITLMIPILFASSVQQINLLVDVILASLLQVGSITWLYLADRLMEFPLGVFSIALATVILPSLSARHAEQSTEVFSATLDWALRMLIVIGTPAMVGLFVLSGPMVVSIFAYGRTGAFDVAMIQIALMAYALGFMGFSLVKVLVPGYFSRQDTRTPVKYGIIAVTASLIMNVAFVGALVGIDHHAPHIGLALATSLGAFVNAGLLYGGLRRQGVFNPLAGWGKLSLQVLLASLAMSALLWWQAGDTQSWMNLELIERVTRLALMILAGAATYFAVLFITGMRPRHLSMPTPSA